jgi:[ribosomal protein S5]-alanine N-acetyltransferase
MLRMRLVTGLVSALIFPFPLILFSSVGGMAVPWGNTGEWIAVLFLYSLPAFVVLGTVLSMAIDSLERAILAQGTLFGYLIKLLLYGAAGFFILAGLYALSRGFSSPLQPPNATAAGWIGAIAAFTYFHLWLVFGKLAASRAAFQPPEPFETERLRLVPCTPERLREAKERGYPVGGHVEWYMRELKRDPTMLGWGTWLIQLRDTGMTIGDAGFKGKPDMSKGVEIGYGFVPSAWGKGYGTETAKALVGWAFRNGAVRVTAETERSNDRSIHVLQKVGFTRCFDNERYYYWQMNRVKQ